MESLEQLNKWLRSFGLALDGSPKFRIVHSEGQYEKRFGDFEDRTPEGFLIRRIGEVREVPKYPMVSPPTWVLERYLPNTNNPELKSNFSYEPLWVFHDINEQPVYPTRQAIQLLLSRVYADRIKKTDKDHYEEDQAKLLKEKQEARDILDNKVPEMVSRLRQGTAIVSPGTSAFGGSDGSF